MSEMAIKATGDDERDSKFTVYMTCLEEVAYEYTTLASCEGAARDQIEHMDLPGMANRDGGNARLIYREVRSRDNAESIANAE